MGWVIQGEIAKLNHGLTNVEKFVLLTFSSFALDDGSSCYPALATVAKRTILSERTVRRVVAKYVGNRVMIPKGKHGNRQFKYQIDLARAKSLHYKPDGEDGPGRPETESGQATDSHDTVSRLATDIHDTLSASYDTLSASYDTLSGNPVKEPVKNPSGASTREAGARDPEAAPACTGAPADEPACAVWKEHYHDLCADFGVEVWQSWLKICIPESDVDGVLTLAVPTAFFRDHIDATYKEGLQKTLGRRIVIVQRGWAADANHVRAYKAHLAEKEAAKKGPPGQAP